MKRDDLFRFRPSGALLPMLGSWVFVVASLYLAFQVFTTKAVALNFILFGIVGVAVGGIGLPVYLTCVIGKRSLVDLGVSTRNLGWSLAIGLVLSVVQYRLTIANVDVPEWRVVVPLVAMTLAVTLYEAVFYRGFVQQVLERCFGIIPSVLLGAGIYTLYHVGYGMAVSELGPLYLVGLTYAVAFRLTRNVFVLWPVLSPLGAMYTHIKEGLKLPFPATWGFLDVLAVMIGIMVWASRKRRIGAGMAPHAR